MSKKKSKKQARKAAAELIQAKVHEETLRLVHHHPGYLRLQADIFVRPEDENLVAKAQAAVEGRTGFRSWSYQKNTGSIVVEYDPESMEADEIFERVRKAAGLGSVENAGGSKLNRHGLVRVVLDTVKDVNRVVGDMTSKRADLREVVPLALAATSAVAFVLHKKRGRLPNWNSALYHSYRIFMQWHKGDVRRVQKGEPLDD